MKINNDILKELVKDVTFTVEEYIEDDNSITLSLLEFDLVVNGRDVDEGTSFLIKDLREYAMEYNEEGIWESDINRKKQIKEIIKVIITQDDEELKQGFRWKKGGN